MITDEALDPYMDGYFYVRRIHPWWTFWRGRWNVLTGRREETDAELRERIAVEIRSRWIKRCADKICQVYGEDRRNAALLAASKYLEAHPNADPISAATLIVKGRRSHRR